MGERISQKALTASDANRRQCELNACLFSLVSHAAMDVPKHFDADTVLALAVAFRSEFGIDLSTPQSTKALTKTLKIPAVSCRKGVLYTNCPDALEKASGNLPLGRVWCPRDRLVLGEPVGRQTQPFQ